MSQEAYSSLLSCTDHNKETKVCTKEEWLSESTPYVRTEESVLQEENYASFDRLRVTLSKKKATES